MASAPVVDLQSERLAREAAAFDKARQALSLAQATGRLRDMAAAVDAFDAYMRLAGMTEAQRSEVLGR